MPSLSLEEFADKVNEAMSVITRQFLKNQTSDFMRIKITIPQLVVLDVLDRHGELKMSDLAKSMSVTTAAITGIADRLVRDGYIIRSSDPKDRRIVKVKLTSEGKDIVHKAANHKKKIVADMFGMISQKEREEYLKILLHIHDHITEKNH